MEGNVEAEREDKGPYTFKHKTYNTTIRPSTCSQLAASDKDGQCPVCSVYRSDLGSRLSYQKLNVRRKARTDVSSNVKHCQMTREELTDKLNNVQKDRQRLKCKMIRMQRQMKHLIEIESVSIVGKHAKEIDHMVSSCSSELDKLLEENTPQKLLWESQKTALAKAKKNPRSMRWHPAIIRWCVALYTKSPSAYKSIRDSKFIILPHENTLRDYIHYTDLQPGFHGDFLLRITEDFKLHNRQDHERHITLVYDEMKIKSGLVFCPHSGKIIGFTQLGSLNEEVKAFEQEVANSKQPPIATHVLVLMIRGITSHLQKPFAYFPCQSGFTSHELYNTMNEAIEILEFAGFKVDAMTGDGASANRKFYTLLKDSSDDSSTIRETTFATTHIIRPEERLFFMSDTPHLIKTTRNCWEHSTEKGTRNMMVS